MQDPRFKNELPEQATISEFLNQYVQRLAQGLLQIPQEKLQQVFELLHKTAARKSRIYVAGNGGSSAIADHLCCDWMKGTYEENRDTIRVHSLSAGTALFTALANDCGFEHSFSRQVEMLGEAGDVLILVSSSGNSPNILHAAEMAKKKEMTVVGFSGFDGGKLAHVSDISLHVGVKNYGIVEDGHQLLMHVFAQFFARSRMEKKPL